MAVTGRSSAKRASRLAKRLRKKKLLLRDRNQLRQYRVGQGEITAALGASNVGFESSGVQALQGQSTISFADSQKTQEGFDKLAFDIRRNMDRAQRAASTFRTVVSLASFAVGPLAGALGTGAGIAAAEGGGDVDIS